MDPHPFLITAALFSSPCSY